MPYPTTDSNPNPKVERKMGYTRKKLHDLDERKKEAERRKAAVLATCAPPSAREREKGERAWPLGGRGGRGGASEPGRIHSARDTALRRCGSSGMKHTAAAMMNRR